MLNDTHRSALSLRLNGQMHTPLSKCSSCGVFHINTIGYGLSERKRVGENGCVSVYYIHAFGFSSLIKVCLINVNQTTKDVK